VRPLVEGLLGGASATVLASGQSNSGKTHTMLGSRGELGMLERALLLLQQQRRQGQVRWQPAAPAAPARRHSPAAPRPARHVLAAAGVPPAAVPLRCPRRVPAFDSQLSLSVAEVWLGQVFDLGPGLLGALQKAKPVKAWGGIWGQGGSGSALPTLARLPVEGGRPQHRSWL
jgi:hypothetical protein